MIRKYKTNTYENGVVSALGDNSATFVLHNFVKKNANVLELATAGWVISGIAMEAATMASDNESSALVEVNYEIPKDTTTYTVTPTGIVLTFSAALIASNTIDMDVNGSALAQVTYASSDANTLGLIAAALQALGTITAATAGTHSVIITPVDANSTVVITNIVVAAGSSQATGSVANAAFVKADEGKHYDITTSGQYLNIASAHATSGQLKMEEYLDTDEATFSIANT